MVQQLAKSDGRRKLLVAFMVGVCVTLFLAGVGFISWLAYESWLESRFRRVDSNPIASQPAAQPDNEARTFLLIESSDAEVREWARITENDKREPPAPQPQRQHNTDELIASINAAFAEPVAELKPAVVFFPVVDGAGKVRPDGFVLGQMALFAAAYTPHHRLENSIPHHRDELLVAGCQVAGATIDAKTIALCTAAIDAKLYILPRLEIGDGKQELIVEFHGDGKAIADRTFRHDIGAGQLCTVPGLAAKDVLEATGVSLSEAESNEVLEPTVRNDDELSRLITLLKRYPAGAKEDDWLANFLEVNPGCALAWDEYLTHGHKAQSTSRLGRFDRIKPSCDRLLIEMNRLVRDSGHAEDVLLALLKLAPTHHHDSGYYATLCDCALLLDDERLLDHIFDLWEKSGPGYAGYLARGGELIEWGWMARGSGAASVVTEKGWKLFHERLNRAKEELESGVEINPLGCRAHVNLMTAALGLSLPAAYAERHFREAIKARPNLYMAYAEKYRYLLPRWFGSNQKLLAFGKECLETDAWDDQIPRLCLSAIEEVRSGMNDEDLADALKEGPLWELLQAYDKAEDKHHVADDNFERNLFARLGAVGGHFDEVLPAYQKLETAQPDSTVFVDAGEYDYFRELVQAHTGKLPLQFHGNRRSQELARVSTALADADLDEVDKALDELKRREDGNERLVSRYRAAVALGRKLDADGAVALTPQQIKDLCIVQNEAAWSVEGDKLVGRKLFGETALELPLGLQHAKVSGLLDWNGPVNAVEIQLHARSTRTKERILFYPSQGRLNFLRGDKMLASEVYRPGPQQFQWELDADREILQPTLGVLWPLPADDRPGGFTMNLWSVGDVTWTISDLRIELKKKGELGGKRRNGRRVENPRSPIPRLAAGGS